MQITHFWRLGSSLGQGAQLLLKIIHNVKKEDMKILCEGVVQIPRILEWRCQNRAKSTISRLLLGVLGIFRGGKGSPYCEIGKICILIKPNNLGLEIFFQKCIVWEIANLAKNSKSGKRGEKGQSCHFHINVVFYSDIKLAI
jgi:hypothetical protein